MQDQNLAEIREFMQGRLRQKGYAEEIGDDQSLFLSGRLDSLDAMDTMVHLEQKFALDFAGLAFDLSLIDSPRAVLALVQRFGVPR